METLYERFAICRAAAHIDPLTMANRNAIVFDG